MDCIEIDTKKGIYKYHKKGDFNNLELTGELIERGDTIIINKGVAFPSIKLVEITKNNNFQNYTTITIFDTDGDTLQYIESWTDDPEKYCCVINEGTAKFSDYPSFDTLMINPIFQIEHMIFLSIEDFFELGYDFGIVVSEPDKYISPYEAEKWF